MRGTRSFLCVSALVVWPVLSGAATLRVPDDARSVQEAIDGASDGDTIVLAPGEYRVRAPITFRGKAITVRGEAGPEKTTLRMSIVPSDGARTSVVIFEHAETRLSVLQDVTLTAGRGTEVELRLEPPRSVTGGGGICCVDGASPTLRNVRVTENGGDSVYGGGLLCMYGAAPELIDCEFTFNDGSGVCSLFGGAPVLRHCRIRGNRCSALPVPLWFGQGGGVSCSLEGRAALVDCTITWNQGSVAGALLCNDENSSADLTNCTVFGNRGRWAIVVEDESSLKIKNCIVWGNEDDSLCDDSGSTIDVSYSCLELDGVWPGSGVITTDPLFCGWGNTDELYVREGPFLGGRGTERSPFRNLTDALEYSLSLAPGSPCIGTAEAGGTMGASLGICESAPVDSRTVYVSYGEYDPPRVPLLRDVDIIGAGKGATAITGDVVLQAGSSLKGVTVKGTVRVARKAAPVLRDCTITESAGVGLDVSSDASALVADCRIVRNRSWGVICDYPSTAHFTRCTIHQNGAGVWCRSGETTLDRCTISGNNGPACSLEGRPGEGAGTLRACVVTGNRGGVTNRWYARLALSNCVIAGNATGIFVREQTTSTCVNCTIVQNRGPEISLVEPASLQIKNSIIWDHRDTGSSGTTLRHAAADYSCLKDYGIAMGDGNITADPAFFSFGSYDFDASVTTLIGGEERELPNFVVTPGDYRLKWRSPCIDRGDAGDVPEIDIMGNARPCWNGVDMGAHEYCGRTPPERPAVFLRGDTTTDGRRTVSDAVFLLRYLCLGHGSPTCLDACDVNDDGVIQLVDAIALLRCLFVRTGFLPEPFPKLGLLPEPADRCGYDQTRDELTCISFGACP